MFPDRPTGGDRRLAPEVLLPPTVAFDGGQNRGAMPQQQRCRRVPACDQPFADPPHSKARGDVAAA